MIKIEENYKVETLDFDFDIGDSLGHIGGVSFAIFLDLPPDQYCLSSPPAGT